MLARYKGRCTNCPLPIIPGQDIGKFGGGWAHAQCITVGERTVRCKAGWCIPDETKPEGYRRVQCPNEIPTNRLTDSGMCAACSDS